MAGTSSAFLNDDLRSEFDTHSEVEKTRKRRLDLTTKTSGPRPRKADKEFFETERNKEQRKQTFLAMDAYTRHKTLVNEYLLYYPGATSKVLKRDTSRDKTDLDVIRENSKFLWDDSAEPESWEQKLAKRYYDKLFKEYCIADLSRYKENKVALRWRVEKEVIDGKGQFTCGEKRCTEKEGLTSWEVNFGYTERGEKKNALIKLRLCPECSYKLNYHHKRRQASRKKIPYVDAPEEKRHKSGSSPPHLTDEPEEPTDATTSKAAEANQQLAEKELWSKPAELEEEKTREDEFTEFLEDLLV